MMRLNTLTPAGKDRKRIGRGGSRGGTSGRGHKGQRARTSGNVRPGFEGGQMPLVRRLPKHGFNNINFKVTYIPVSLDRIASLFESGATVDKEVLIEKGILKRADTYFKVLGGTVITKKLQITANAFSAAAQAAIENAGGQTTLIKEK